MSALGAILGRNPKLRELTGKPGSLPMGELVHKLMEPGTERLLEAAPEPKKFTRSKTSAAAIRRMASRGVAVVDKVVETESERKHADARGRRLGLRQGEVVGTRQYDADELKAKLVELQGILASIKEQAEAVLEEIG